MNKEIKLCPSCEQQGFCEYKKQVNSLMELDNEGRIGSDVTKIKMEWQEHARKVKHCPFAK